MRGMAVKISLVAAMLVAGPVQAYDVHGIRLGMTPSQVEGVFGGRTFSHHLQILDGSLLNGSGIIRNDKDKYDIPASLYWCGGQVQGASAMIDPDTEYLDQLGNLLLHGNPVITIQSQPWSGPGGGIIREVRMRWKVNGQLIDLSSTSEGRDGKGGLRYSRAASIRVSTGLVCPTGRQ